LAEYLLVFYAPEERAGSSGQKRFSGHIGKMSETTRLSNFPIDKAALTTDMIGFGQFAGLETRKGSLVECSPKIIRPREKTQAFTR
jgi:hypothetical protein